MTSPFRWSTAGLKSFNNMAQYRVDEADADVPRDRVSPLHVPQLQLEAAAAECVGTLVVSYAPCGNTPGGAAMRLSYVPPDEEYRRGIFSLLRKRWSGGVCRDVSRRGAATGDENEGRGTKGSVRGVRAADEAISRGGDVGGGPRAHRRAADDRTFADGTLTRREGGVECDTRAIRRWKETTTFVFVAVG